MRNWILGALCLWSVAGFAERGQRCEDWPQVVSGSGPRGAVTGLPLTYNFILNCVPGPEFVIGEFAAHYQSPTAQLKALESLAISPINGDYLYQALFLVPHDQEQGLYEISGCLVIQRNDGESRCLPIPPDQMNLMSRFL